MKIKVTKPDGTVIEAEGSAEECRTLVEERPATEEYVPMPYQPVIPYTPPVFPYGPYTYPATVDKIIITCEPSTAGTVVGENTTTNTMYLSIPDLSSEEMQERLKTFRTEWEKANMGRTLGRGRGGYIPNCS